MRGLPERSQLEFRIGHRWHVHQHSTPEFSKLPRRLITSSQCPSVLDTARLSHPSGLCDLPLRCCQRKIGVCSTHIRSSKILLQRIQSFTIAECGVCYERYRSEPKQSRAQCRFSAPYGFDRQQRGSRLVGGPQVQINDIQQGISGEHREEGREPDISRDVSGGLSARRSGCAVAQFI